MDYDAESNLAGIDIDHASRKLELRELVRSHMPVVAKASPWLDFQGGMSAVSETLNNQLSTIKRLAQLLQKTFDRMK